MRLARLYIAVCWLLVFVPATQAEAGPSSWLIPPVDGPIVRSFVAPASGYTAGHRGVDFAAEPGTAVRAAGDGVVRFAGDVAVLVAVSIDHGNGMLTTYGSLSEVSVSKGQVVTAGTWIGRVGRSHPGESSGLHFGVKVGDAYVDPEQHLGPLDASGAVHLETLSDETQRISPGCPTAVPRGAPNSNIAVAVAGIGSKTKDGTAADMYERGPELLGYPPHRVYRFSYEGTDGPGFHEPYDSSDTFGGIRDAASRLGDQLRSIAKTHPGKAVDLIAHSQGGVVARAFLAEVAREWDPELPRVQHLVTFSSPHSGAPLAGISQALHKSVVGRPALWALGGVTKLLGGGLPDPGSRSVLDLAPHSDVMESLGGQDILYGTRALALGTGGDVIVPADRSGLAGETSAWVDADGWNRHSSIVGGSQSLAAAHAFLRGAEGCSVGSGTVPLAGRLIGGAEWGFGQLVRVAVTAPSKMFRGPGL